MLGSPPSLPSPPGGRPARARAALIGLLAVLTAGFAALSSAASAATLTSTTSPLGTSSFQAGDGNQSRNAPWPHGGPGLTPPTDWQDLVGSMALRRADDPRTPDLQFNGKEHSPVNWALVTANDDATPSSMDFKVAWNAFTDNRYLFLAFRRATVGGNSFLAFELNQDARTWRNATGASVPCRKTGDIIVTVEPPSSNTNAIGLYVEEWTTSTTVTAADVAAGMTDGLGCAKTGTLTAKAVTAAQAQAAVNNAVNNGASASTMPPVGQTWGAGNGTRPNDGAIPAYLEGSTVSCDGSAGFVCAGLFGEAGLDLKSLFGTAADTACFSFGSMWMHGRSSTSDSANLQDYVSPIPVAVRSCTASGRKFHDLDGDGDDENGADPGLAGWVIYADFDGDGVKDAGEPSATTAADGTYTITDLKPLAGDTTYTLREQAPAGEADAGWKCSTPGGDDLGTAAIECGHAGLDVSAAPNEVGRDFGNYRNATVIVDKVTTGTGASQDHDFNFDTTPSAAAPAGLGAGFALDGDDTPRSVSITPDLSGTYTVAELADAAAADYDLTALDCAETATPADSSTSGRTATIRAQSGETVTCTFTNTRKTGRLKVRKALDPVTDAGRFDLSVAGDVKRAGAGHGDASDWVEVPAGVAQTIAEAPVGPADGADYVTTVACADQDGAPVSASGTGLSRSVTVAQGRDVTCTFTNVRKGSLEIAKRVESVDPADDDVDFGFTASSGLAAPPGEFALRHAGTKTFTRVVPGAHSVTEAPAPGFRLTDITCVDTQGTAASDDDIPVAGAGDLAARRAAVDVAAGQALRCVFTNTKDGRVEIVKAVDSVDAADKDVEFAFTPSMAGGTFTLADGDPAKVFSAVAPGAYTVAETAKPGFTLTRVQCVNPGGGADAGSTNTAVTPTGVSTTASIDVAAGETVRCTFTNTAKASIAFEKDVESAAAGDQDVEFAFTPAAGLPGGAFPLTGAGAAKTYGGLVPNVGAGADTNLAYGATEAAKAGFRLTAIACSDDDSTDAASGAGLDPRTATVKLAAGEDVTCVFTNTRNATLTLTKTESGGAVTRAWEFQLTGGPDGVDVTRTTDPAKPGGGELDFGQLREGTYTLCERHIPEDWHTSLEEAPHNGAREADGTGQVKVCITIALSAGEDEAIAVDNTRPSTLVVKEGNTLVHHGDTITYTFEVTNTGNTALKDVSVIDARCESPNGTASYTGGDTNGDDRLQATEKWAFTCTAQVPASHAAGEENPIHNVATAQAFDDAGNKVTDTDIHDTWIIHPDIEVDKRVALTEAGPYGDGPIEARPGATLFYEFTVTNPGDTALAVTFDDPRCDVEPAAPASGDTDGDGRLDAGEKADTDKDGKLDTAETWTYRCSHELTAGDADPFENTVTVTGTDPIEGTDSDSDKVTADVLNPKIDVEKTQRRGTSGAFTDATIQAHAGDVVEYRFEVRPTGSDTAMKVTFEDDLCDTLPAGPESGDTDGDGWLDLDETWVYACSHEITPSDPDPFTNTVEVTGTDRAGGTATDTDAVTADVLHPDIEVDKTLRRGSSGDFGEGPVSAKVGDRIEYRFAVTNPGDAVLAVTFSDPKCDAGTLTGPTGDTGATAGRLDPGETWVYRCSHVLTAQDPSPFTNVVTVTGTDDLGGKDTDSDDESVDKDGPGIQVVKDGPATAYHGDQVTYTFVVTNTGNVPLRDVTVADDKCAPVTGPTEKRAGDQDADLEPGEAWVYSCTRALPAHEGGEANPVVNTATATGRDRQGDEVKDTDTHETTLLHPAIHLDKTGPASAAAGSRVPFTLTVTNPGDVAIGGDSVKVTDSRCDGPPEEMGRLRDGAADPTPATLDPGDAWVYRCFAPTAADATSVTNVATVGGTDVNGRPVGDDDDHTVALARQEVLPEVVISGASRLQGPSGCTSRPFTARVTGRRIKSVVWRIDNRVVSRFSSKSGEATKTSFRVVPKRYGRGLHRLTARVTYNKAARTSAKTMRMTFRQCARRALAPRFTG